MTRITWTQGRGPNGAPVQFEPSIALIIPSNRPTCLQDWHAAWEPYLKANDVRGEVTVYDVLDQEETWDTIQTALGDDAWIIPRETDCIRMWGFLRAVRNGADILITMDDDCYPDDPLDAITEHVRTLSMRVEPHGWGRTVPDLLTRGVPRSRSVAMNHGLWTEIPDVSATDQLAGYRMPAPYPTERIRPRGQWWGLSGMNFAIPAIWLPAYYMGLMGKHVVTGAPWGVDRYGDIWGGLGFQRVVDHLGWAAIRSGTPFVRHQRASDPVVNEVRERVGEWDTPSFADVLAMARLPLGTYIEPAAAACAEALASLDTPYWQQYSAAWRRWIALTGRMAR